MLEAIAVLVMFWTIWSLFYKVQKQVEEIDELRKRCEERENQLSERIDSLKKRTNDDD